jgi:integrase
VVKQWIYPKNPLHNPLQFINLNYTIHCRYFPFKIEPIGAMMVKPLMFWVVKQRRWTKQYRGKTYSVSPRKLNAPPTKASSVSAANEWWRRKQAEIDLAPVTPPLLTFHQEQQKAIAEWYRQHGQEEEATAIQRQDEGQFREWWNNLGSEMKDYVPVSVAMGMPEEKYREQYRWMDRIQTMKARDRVIEQLPPDKKISSYATKFLNQKLAEVGVEISAGRYDNLQRTLAEFLSFVGEVEIDKLSGIQLEDFRDYILGKITSKKYGRDYAKDRIANTKQFYRWLWDSEYIDNLPRKFSKINISVPPTKQITYPMDELKKLILHAKPMEKLALLLMANCGFNQRDVSDLRKDEISPDYKYITRRRSKTAKKKSSPIVRYKLWTETRQLLGAASRQCKDKTYALCNRNGGRLVTSELRDGKLKNSDAIKCGFFRLCKKLEMPNRPLKLIRKTSATLLKNSPYGHLQSLFLGHSPRDMADRHYSGEVSLDDAIDYLGKQYGY